LDFRRAAGVVFAKRFAKSVSIVPLLPANHRRVMLAV
jgi:hypothetical protein